MQIFHQDTSSTVGLQYAYWAVYGILKRLYEV